MKSKEKELEDNIDFSEKAFKERFRVVTGDELLAHKKRVARALAANKQRVTIYFDTDIVDRFKDIASTRGTGYQTLMNEALRGVIENLSAKNGKGNLKEDILNDKKFLKRLKTALST